MLCAQNYVNIHVEKKEAHPNQCSVQMQSSTHCCWSLEEEIRSEGEEDGTTDDGHGGQTCSPGNIRLLNKRMNRKLLACGCDTHLWIFQLVNTTAFCWRYCTLLMIMCIKLMLPKVFGL